MADQLTLQGVEVALVVNSADLLPVSGGVENLPAVPDAGKASSVFRIIDETSRCHLTVFSVAWSDNFVAIPR